MLRGLITGAEQDTFEVPKYLAQSVFKLHGLEVVGGLGQGLIRLLPSVITTHGSGRSSLPLKVPRS